jgi:hypothetical protein
MADFAELSRSLAAFARAVGHPLTDWQADALTLETRLTCIAAGRQMGKSRALALLALWWSFKRRDQMTLIVSASDHAARRVLALARSIAAASELLSDSVVDEQRQLLRLSNGSTIRSVSASAGSIRGWSVDLGICDEAALVDDELILDAFIPTMAARRDARTVMVSSANRATGAFYDAFMLGQAGDENTRSFRWVSSLVGGDCRADWIAPSGLALAEATFAPVRFNAEYRADFAGGGSALFTPVQLAKMFVDYEPDTLATLRPAARVVLGCDWGASADRSACVALGRIPLPGGRRLFAVRAARRWDAGTPLPEVVREIAATPGLLQAVAGEMNGLGAPCFQLLTEALERRPWRAGGGKQMQSAWRVVQEVTSDLWKPPAPRKPQRFQGFITERWPITTSALSKAAAWSAIRLAVDKGQLIAPSSELELRRELSLLEVELGASGVEKIAAGSGHDDLADSLSIACVPYQRRGGWGSALADWCDPRRALPDDVQVPAAVAASEHVEGPDGLMIPRRPAWQSISGADLTVPEQLDFAEPTGDPVLRELRERIARNDPNDQRSDQ